MNMNKKRIMVWSIMTALYLANPICVQAAEDIVYNNGSYTLKTINFPTIPVAVPQSLFSATSKTNNTVTVLSGNISGAVAGGVTAVADDIYGNTVNINGGNIGGTVAGGWSHAGGKISNNTVNINNGISWTVYGGLSENGPAVSNIVNVNGGTVKQVILGGWSKVDISSDNVLNLNGGVLEETAWGGYSDTGKVSRNTVNISSGKTMKSVYGGTSWYDDSTQNIVEITGGTVEGNVIGGAAYYNKTSSYNHVVLNGGQVNGSIAAGRTTTGSAINNTVSLLGTTMLSASTVLYGGMWADNGSGPAIELRRGNTLNISWHGTLKAVENFENYNFILTPNTTNGSTMLNVTEAKDITASNIKLTGSNATIDWQNGDKVILLSKSTGAPTLTSGKVQQGLVKMYDYTMNSESNGAVYVIFKAEPQVNPRTQAITTGAAAANSFLASTISLTDEIDVQEKVFFTFKHYNTKIGSSSHADVKGTAFIGGVSSKIQYSNSALIVSGFMEGGWSSYDTLNSGIYGNGKVNYYGVGAIARNESKNGIYTKGIARIGRVSNKYSSKELNDGLGNYADYSVSSLYYGLNLQLGKIIKLDHSHAIDLYGKYSWVHEKGAEDIVIVGEKFNFSAVNSHRVRVGAKLKSAVSKSVETYLDLSYEYELDGRAKANSGNMEIPSISMQGGTALAEIGMKYKPQKADNFSFYAGLQGYVGKRKGVSGNVQFAIGF